MKIGTSWLREWVDPAVSTEEICQRLTAAGLEVDGFKSVGAPFTGVVIAEITHIELHPKSSDLTICTVTIGTTQSIDIVCGAPNVQVGMKTAFAPVGAILPNDLVVQQKTIQGIVSNGILCSSKELGLDQDHSGVITLDDDTTIGDDLAEVLEMNDTVIEFDLTPNRGDCFSVRGISREVSLLFDCPASTVAVTTPDEKLTDSVSIQLDDPVGCPLYLGRVLRNIDVHVPTPWQITHRLRCSGLRPINVVVDILSYVMLELGQPMHAFDLAHVENGIVVRKSSGHEKLVLLDGSKVKLDSETLLITSADRPVAIAGVIGGLESSVQDQTTDIFLEVAYFSPSSMLGTARRYGLHTDASLRYERGVDSSIQQQAMHRATELILRYTGAEVGPISEQRYEKNLPTNASIAVSYDRLRNLIGHTYEPHFIEAIFNKIGCDVNSNDDGWTVFPPPHRFDISIEQDLVEEVCRIAGYDDIPPKPLYATLELKQSAKQKGDASELRQRLSILGYHEVVTYSFIQQDSDDIFRGPQASINVQNPISSDRDTMRSSLVPGMLQVCAYNLARQQNSVRIFEYGQCFTQKDNELVQEDKIAGLLCGRRDPESWTGSKENIDLFDIKADVEALLGSKVKWFPSAPEWLQPGACATVKLNATPLGVIGKVQPAVVQKLEIEKDVYIFELHVKRIRTQNTLTMQPISSFPSVRRDLAIVVQKEITAAQIENLVGNICGDLLRRFIVFDVYESETVGKNKKSVGIGMVFQHATRTLADTEINELVDAVAQNFTREFEATLR